MILISDKSKCCGCEACMEICPQQYGMTMNRDDLYFNYPVFHKEICINWRQSDAVCPYNMQNKGTDFLTDRDIMVGHRSVAIRSKARDVILHGGIVAAPILSDDCHNMVYRFIRNEEDILNIQYYLQLPSSVYPCMSQIRGYLQQGKEVLFIGNPCNIAGLKSFLQKEYTNLICGVVLCGGLVSPMLWRDYLIRLGSRYGASARRVYITTGSSDEHVLNIEFQNGKKYRCIKEKDPFYQMANSGVGVRPSCADCSFRKMAYAHAGEVERKIACYTETESEHTAFMEEYQTGLLQTKILKHYSKSAERQNRNSLQTR